ncbi:MAG: Ni/Fe-hydrogenase, b-type cytochrome subunit [Betaproteobacteria bacterium]|nr:Ni/Fe-hydrogenase, b-type cytochrome subunit [Betaproteobacteria bacterium]
MSVEGKNLKFPAYVWEAPVRLWHWLMALAMVVLMVTGYFIGSPLPSVPGEAIDSYLMGYIRFAHFAAAYVFALSFLFRVYWAIVGNQHAREIFLVPVYMLSPTWWRGFFRVLGHYLFIRPKNDWHLGHNQLAMAAMFGMYVLGTVFMIVTGFALYGEGTGMGTWQYSLFSSWVIPLFGQSQDVHTWHHFGMWYLIWFTMVHLYFVIREDITSGLTVVSSMISGWRDVKN